MRRHLICVALLAVAFSPALAAGEQPPESGARPPDRTFKMKVPLVGSEIDIPERYRLPLLIAAALVALAYYAPGHLASLRENLGQTKSSRMALELQRMRLENLKLQYEIEGLKKEHGIDLPEAEAQVAEEHTRELRVLEATEPGVLRRERRSKMVRDQLRYPSQRKRFMGRRFLAFVIDYLSAGFLAGFLLGILLAVVPELGTETLDLVWTATAFAFYTLYFPVLWAAKGATLGLMVFGLRIVGLDGQPLGLKQVLIRLLGFWFLGAVGFLWLAFDKQKQALHDKLAGTLVVKVRGRLERELQEFGGDMKEQNEASAEGLSYRKA